MTGEASAHMWRMAHLHIILGLAILFLTLHPLRDALDAHGLALTQTASTLQALNGIGLLLLARRPQSRIAAWLVTLGTLAFSSMIYVIAFTGTHPFDLAVPIGGFVMLAGWIKLAFERP